MCKNGDLITLYIAKIRFNKFYNYLKLILYKTSRKRYELTLTSKSRLFRHKTFLSTLCLNYLNSPESLNHLNYMDKKLQPIFFNIFYNISLDDCLCVNLFKNTKLLILRLFNVNEHNQCYLVQQNMLNQCGKAKNDIS